MRLPMSPATSMALLFSVVSLTTTVAWVSARAAGQFEAASSPAVERDGKVVWSGSYSQHIQPVFDRYCVSCHGRTGAGGRLVLTSYEEVMNGIQHSPVVVPGSAADSSLVSVLKGTDDPRVRTRHAERRLGEEETRNVALWIEAGACPD